MRLVELGIDGEVTLPKEFLELYKGNLNLVDIRIDGEEIVIRPLGANVIPFKAVGE